MAPRIRYNITRSTKPFELNTKTETATFSTYNLHDYVITTAALDVLKVEYSVIVDVEPPGTVAKPYTDSEGRLVDTEGRANLHL